MEIYSSYACKIKGQQNILKETVRIYRAAVDFFLDVCLKHWDDILLLKTALDKRAYIEAVTHATKENKIIWYDFDQAFYKFPSYLRRSAMTEAIGKVSSYKSNLQNWEQENPTTRGNCPALPKAGRTYPCLYKKNTFLQTGVYTAKIKVWIRNTWDWMDITFQKSDMDYLIKHCSTREHGAPSLLKKGKQWFLSFPFQEQMELVKTPAKEQVILAVDLGINNACVCSVMKADGTVLGRRFVKLSREYDCLLHKLNHIKRAQCHGSRKVSVLWRLANYVNDDIAAKTAAAIVDTAVLYNVDVIVFEHLDLNARKRGSKKQKLHLWKARKVQSIVTDKAHRHGMRVSHICAWNTSRLAFDGSGKVLRGKESSKISADNYSMCEFPSGKLYHCDLNASYNIGARYFIRELLKSVSVTKQQHILAKVPECAKRSTCTLSTLISLNAVL